MIDFKRRLLALGQRVVCRCGDDGCVDMLEIPVRIRLLYQNTSFVTWYFEQRTSLSSPIVSSTSSTLVSVAASRKSIPSSISKTFVPVATAPLIEADSTSSTSATPPCKPRPDCSASKKVILSSFAKRRPYNRRGKFSKQGFARQELVISIQLWSSKSTKVPPSNVKNCS